jgi:hypothetical protein
MINSARFALKNTKGKTKRRCGLDAADRGVNEDFTLNALDT